MADTKISALTALTGANLATDDDFAVVDTSATTTKRISKAELLTGLAAAVGPASSTDNALARFDSTTGKLLQNSSGATLSDTFALTLTGATVTASEPMFNVTQTWNSSGVTFTALKLNVTATASSASSLLLDLQVAGVSKFGIDKQGFISGLSIADVGATDPKIRFGSSVGGAKLAASYNLRWASDENVVTSADTALARNAAGVLEINTATAGQYRDLKLRTLIVGGTQTTTMTDGFIQVPGASGAVTGVPANTVGVPLYYDTTNFKLYAYSGGAWKSSAAFA